MAGVIGLVLELAGLALAVVWGWCAFGVAGASGVAAVVLVFLGFVISQPGTPAEQQPKPEEDETSWTF